MASIIRSTLKVLVVVPGLVLCCLAADCPAEQAGGLCAAEEANTNDKPVATCTLPHSASDARRPYCHVPPLVSKEAQAYLSTAHATVVAIPYEFYHNLEAVELTRQTFINAAGPFNAAAMRMFLQDVQNDTIVDGVVASWATPKGYNNAQVEQDAGHTSENNEQLLIYLHGGAYVRGECHAHGWATVGAVAAAAGLKVLCVDYRLAPEHPFPAGLEDAFAVYKHVTSQLKYKPQNIALLGDSAGGGLCMALLQKLLQASLPLPSAAVLFAPWVDLTGSGDTYTTLTAVDPMLQLELNLKGAALAYVAGKESLLHDPLVSPIFADYTDAAALYPPILIQVGLRDTLLSGCALLYRKLKDAGIEHVEFSPYEGMWHVFQAFFHVPEAQAASKEASAFLMKHTGRLLQSVQH